MRALEVSILTLADAAPVVKGTGGLRKIRFSPPDMNLSKREAFRVCYALFPTHGTTVMITFYAKNEKSDLSPSDRKAIAQLLKRIEEQFDREAAR